MKKNKQLILTRILMWASLAIVTLFLVYLIIVVVNPDVYKNSQGVVIIICLVIIMIFSAITALTFNTIMTRKAQIYQVETENLYTLGEPTQFNNLDLFKAKVNNVYKRRHYANKEQYLIAFTPTGLDISSNRNRDKILMNVNLQLTKFLEKLFEDKNNEFDKRFNIYAFSRGIFYFFVFTNDGNYIHKLMNVISNECYRMVNEDKVKIWIQPFYGIDKLDEESTIASAIEDALIARDRSEKNYESFTYFKKSFREDEGGSSNEIATALANNEFVPYYQPKYSVKEGRFVSAEALARWNSMDYGLVGPAKFIDKAERAGLLNAIDTRIFELAVRDISENLKRGRRVLPVSVNFSLYEFFSRNFLITIVDTLKKYQVPATLLEIEITETTSQVNKFLSLSVIKKLKDIGIRVLMDDFGVGYSQIENLRQIPFNAIKIDKSFTDKIASDEKTRSITKFLTELGHANNMEVIVEGVETKEEVEYLKKIKVDTIQGFYYSRPLSFDKYNELLKSNQFERGNKKWLSY